MKQKVKIKSITEWNKYHDWQDITEVYVDGECIVRESYGGEPEDNSRCRDYSWVEPLLKTLSEKLGADVEFIKEEIPYEKLK